MSPITNLKFRKRLKVGRTISDCKPPRRGPQICRLSKKIDHTQCVGDNRVFVHKNLFFPKFFKFMISRIASPREVISAECRPDLCKIRYFVNFSYNMRHLQVLNSLVATLMTLCHGCVRCGIAPSCY